MADPVEIANAGAGSLPDLAKQAASEGGTRLLTDGEGAAYGAGFVSDMLRLPGESRKMQNTTHAVMAQRHETAESPDDFPTPPWATRALIEHVIGKAGLETMSCLEPACGRGHMSRTLEEYFGSVASSDAYDYGYGPIRDFLSCPCRRVLARLGHHQSTVQIGGGVRQSRTDCGARRRGDPCQDRVP